MIPSELTKLSNEYMIITIVYCAPPIDYITPIQNPEAERVMPVSPFSSTTQSCHHNFLDWIPTTSEEQQHFDLSTMAGILPHEYVIRGSRTNA